MRPSPILLKDYRCIGGRAAEEIVLGEVSTGAYSDLKQANGIARSMITKYGMSDTLGNLVFAMKVTRYLSVGILSRQKTTVRR